MSQTWYPKIDAEKCTGCFTCVRRCRNGVLAQGSNDKAQVVHPENCVDNCWGCFTICKAKAINMPEDFEAKRMGCNACGRTPCRFGARGVSSYHRSLATCQGMATLRMLKETEKRHKETELNMGSL